MKKKHKMEHSEPKAETLEIENQPEWLKIYKVSIFKSI